MSSIHKSEIGFWNMFQRCFLKISFTVLPVCLLVCKSGECRWVMLSGFFMQSSLRKIFLDIIIYPEELDPIQLAE